jgi:hypothetical protein
MDFTHKNGDSFLDLAGGPPVRRSVLKRSNRAFQEAPQAHGKEFATALGLLRVRRAAPQSQ